ncbi:MAG: HEAT repeat domain-containing protein [Candidatus Omnitrophota bacterium]|nr:HEAT repeat domain-containing protein [Candidatus Omnitrophota bacterium]
MFILIFSTIFSAFMAESKAVEKSSEQGNLQKIVQRWDSLWKMLHLKKLDEAQKKYFQKEYGDIISTLKNLSEEGLIWLQAAITKIEGKPKTEEEAWGSMGSMIHSILISRWENQLEKPKVLVDKVLPIVMNNKFPDLMRANYIYYAEGILLTYRNKRLIFPEKDMQAIVDTLVELLDDRVNNGPLVKIAAIETVFIFGKGERAINSVIDFLDDKDEEIVITTLRYLVFTSFEEGKRSKKFATQKVYEKLSHIVQSPGTYSNKVIDEAILAIGSLQFSEGKEILLKKFNEEKDIDKLQILMKSLCAYGDNDLIELVLNKRNSKEVKDIEGLQVCSPGDEKVLIKFAQEKDGEILIFALKELKNISGGAFRLTEALPLIESKISHKDKWVRSAILDTVKDKVKFEISLGSYKDSPVLNKTLLILKERLPQEDDKELQSNIRENIKLIEDSLKEEIQKKEATG